MHTNALNAAMSFKRITLVDRYVKMPATNGSGSVKSLEDGTTETKEDKRILRRHPKLLDSHQLLLVDLSVAAAYTFSRDLNEDVHVTRANV
jgi:hypothetical protein